MKYLFLFLGLFFHLTIFPTGFGVGTLVKTLTGYIAVEELKKGDKIIGVNTDGFYDVYTVKDVKKHTSNKQIKITTDNDALFVSPDQQFVSPTNKLVKASDLKPGTTIFSMNESYVVRAVETIDEYNELYTIHMNDVVAFFVAAQSIAVANGSRSFLQSIGSGFDKALTILSHL